LEKSSLGYRDCIKEKSGRKIGIAIEVGEHLTIDYTYAHLRVTLSVHVAISIPNHSECEEIRWVTLDEIDQLRSES